MVVAAWLVLSLCAAGAIGVAAGRAQAAGFAPLLIGPLISGVLLGTALAVGARFCGLVRRRWLLVASGALALVTSCTVHGVLYRQYCDAWHRVRQEAPALDLFKPEEGPASPVPYLVEQAGGGRILLWLFDGGLILTATLVIVAQGVPPAAPPADQPA